MAEKKPSRKTSAPAFTPEERAAMKDRAREQKAAKGRAAGEADLLAKVAEMPKADRAIAERIHAIVKTAAPDLLPKTWYGMPAYANADGKVSASSRAAPSSRRAMRRSASTSPRISTTA